jgi:hypothetical protein
MTDEEFIRRMLTLEKLGYCWRCNQKGQTLKYDPMGDRTRDNRLTGLCEKCCGERRAIARNYEHLGTKLRPNRTNEPVA